ncbi:hypothetical protein SKAU_G00011600 [Synaphobranchus kaupii]|uniref:Uncharacterized protein n=1 Tax=Synaphobranchus kaupii TaxID=118154 RepID=A0A9Q1JDD9_SYNKA|nr:hypothetical protein SKAU_G00011600 [Synaphobranchus kaupii]
MSVVADSESDTDDNLYTNRLMCADSFSLTPSLKVSFWAIECSPEIETLAYRRLTEVDKTALISGKINSLGSTSVSSGSSEEVLACDEEGCLTLQQEIGCTAVHCEGFNKHARNGIMGKTKSEQMYPLGEQEPVNPFVEFKGKLPSDRLTTPPARRVTLHSSQGKGGNGRERRAQVGVTCSASRPLEAEQESGPSFRSRSFSEKETLSSVPSARSSAILRGGEPAHKPQSVHTIQTRSACCVSQPAVAVDSTQQDRMACQSPPQPMGRRKIAQGRAHTRSETSASDCGRANLNGSGRSRMAGAESGQNTRRLRPLSGTPKINTKRKRKAPSEAEGSVCGSRDVNRGKGEYRTHSFAPQRSKTPRGKKKEALQRRGGKVVTLQTINRRNHRGETLLHRAATDGDMQLITAILQLGVDVNRADYAGWTPLHEAVMGGWYETVAALLEAGAVVNCTGDKGVTPLHDAIDNGHHEIAQLLLDSGANPLLKNEQGRTALDMTDDDSLRKMIERYLHRTRTVSLSAQRMSTRFAVQEDGNRQQVVCTMQKKKEESAADETDAEQQAGGEPSSQITSPSLCLRSRSVNLPPVPGHPSTCPEGRQSSSPGQHQPK